MNRYAFMTYTQYCKAIENMTAKDAERLSEIRHQACKDNSNQDSVLHNTADTLQIRMLFKAMSSIEKRLAKGQDDD